MTRRDVTVKFPNGLHLTPISKIVQMVQAHQCPLRVHKGDRIVDGSSMLDMLSLVAEQGTALVLEANGDREAELIDNLVRFFDSADI